MVCRKFKIYISAFSCTCSYETISRMNEVNKKRTLPCVTKIILTEKLFGVGSSNFGFVHLDNWATH